jgi:hypothetical protein
MLVLAIDPGEVHCGVALYADGQCIDAQEMTPDELYGWLMEGPDIAVLVCEEFRLYPDKMKVQGYSQLKTVEVIGVLRYLSVGNYTFVEQGASIKKVARAQMARLGVEDRAVVEHKGGHASDAVVHGWYYINKLNKDLNDTINRIKRKAEDG